MSALRNLSGLLLVLVLAPAVVSQGAMPTTNTLTRILMIESRYGRGTTFSIDVDEREYWITAKHIISGKEHPPYGTAGTDSVILRILNPGAATEEWIEKHFAVIDPGPDIDIVVLAPDALILSNPLPSPPADPSGIPLGGDCEFLGFPYGGGWRAQIANGTSFWMPYVKHCTVSSFPFLATGVAFYVLDGINNVGFSGGPVVSQTGTNQKIFAVISGYHTEPTEVLGSAAHKPEQAEASGPRKLRVELNSGFIIAYSIHYATDAIQKHPIGPLRKPK